LERFVKSKNLERSLLSIYNTIYINATKTILSQSLNFIPFFCLIPIEELLLRILLEVLPCSKGCVLFPPFDAFPREVFSIGGS